MGDGGHLHKGDGFSVDAVQDLLGRLDDAEFTARYGALFLILSATDIAPTGGKPGTQDIPPEPGESGPLRYKIFPVKKGGSNALRHVTIGRTRNNDVWIDDATLSKFHAFIVIDDDGPMIYDAESSNGTFVNGALVCKRGEGEPTAVLSKSSIQFGGLNTTVVTAADLRAFLGDLPRTE